MTDPSTRSTRLPTVASEVALVLVHLAVVCGFVRLYEDWSFVGVLAAFTLGAHVLAILTRRRRVPVLLVVPVAVAGGLLAASWLLFWSTTRWGLPTGATLDVARDALRVSREQFDEVAAPAPVLPGFQLAAGLSLWAAVWFADWAAFRLRATVEAVAPATVLFVFGALLGSGDHRVSTAALFTGAVLVFVAAHRSLRAQLDQLWLTSSPVTGPRAVLRAGVGLAVVGLLAGVVVGPRLPGSQAEAMVRWRAEAAGDGDRTTVSPIVDLRKRLVDQRDIEMFTVRTDQRAYLRLTALDVFDGQLWQSDRPFDPVDERLSSRAPRIEDSRRIVDEIRITSLAAIWVPAPYEARSVDRASAPLNWDDESSTLIVGRDQQSSDGLTYTVVAEAPDLDAATLAGADIADPPAIADHYEALPADFPQEVVDAAEAATAGAEGRYAQAVALQNWFRNEFTYSLDVDSGHSDSALLAFLASREGYCEQFAGAYAAMARSLGIPARVAIGFTPGDVDPADPNLYRVLGKHAHAWPEVWFPEVGWVPFEPTPGRGIPQAEDYTGVAEQQNDTTPTTAPGTTTSTTTASGETAPAPTTTPADEQRSRTASGAAGVADDDGGPGPLAVAAGIAALLGLWLALLLIAPVVLRRRRASNRPDGAVLESWHEALAPVRWLTGLTPSPAETHEEFAGRAAGPLGARAGAFTELAGLATVAAWAPAGVPDRRAADRAAELEATLRAAATEDQRPVERVRRRLSWREAFDRPRPAAPA